MTKKYEITIKEDDKQIHRVYYNVDDVHDAIKLLVNDMQEEGLF